MTTFTAHRCGRMILRLFLVGLICCLLHPKNHGRVYGWMPAGTTTTSSSSFNNVAAAAPRFRNALTALFSSTENVDLHGKMLIQRIFYRYSSGSEVDVHDSMVVEERLRFRPDPGRPGYVVPAGHKTIILRDGQVEDGEIGDDFFSLDIHEPKTAATSGAASGKGPLDPELETCIATALYLASNPKLCNTPHVLELACSTGLASLLGMIGTHHVLQRNTKNKNANSDSTPTGDDEDDVLTVPNKMDPKHSILPPSVERYVLTDSENDALDAAYENVKNAQHIPPSKIRIEKLNWKQRQPAASASSTPRSVSSQSQQQRGGMGFMGIDESAPQSQPSRSSASTTINPNEYTTIIASDVAFTFPEAKQLARTVAYKLAPSRWSYTSADVDGSSTIPTFVHVCPDQSRDDVVYLKKLLSQGYGMTVSTGYLKMEKLTFKLQTLPESENVNENDVLDRLDLELKHVQDVTYQSIQAVHSTEYLGDGTGEMFFPMETGAYDGSAGGGATSSPYLERDTTQGQWYNPEV